MTAAHVAGSRVERGIVVAGIPVLHELPDGWALDPTAFAGWVDGRVASAPLLLRHELGDGRGLHLVLDSPDTQEGYYVDDAQELAVRFSARRPGEREQWMRTVRAGHEYRLLYESPAECAMRQWRWQRTAVMYALASRAEGVMMHACGFTTATGRGVLCPGASGVGKSTLAAQVASELGAARVLSDDRLALTVEGDAARIWGTPWHSSGGFMSSVDAGLTAIVLPGRSHGAPPSVRALAATAALPRLLRAVAAPFWSASGMEAMLATLDVVLRNVPVMEYLYTPGPGAASVLLEALG